MNKTIYKYLFYEFIRYFVAALFAMAAIVWTIQAVNYLDLITEDGHAFRVYFLYSLLTVSKVLTKIIPFCFLIKAERGFYLWHSLQMPNTSIRWLFKAKPWRSQTSCWYFSISGCSNSTVLPHIWQIKWSWCLTW